MTNKPNPMISVVMSVYNGEKYLRECVDSILNQTFVDFEFIIVNDDSTDNTKSIILSYDDKRIHYLENEVNLERSISRNKAINVASGKYIAIMDADDISLPNRFAEQIKFMQNNHNIDVCGSWLQTFGDTKSVWQFPLTDDEIKMSMLFNSALMHPTILAKNTFFTKLKYDESMMAAEDYDLWVRGIDDYYYANIPMILLNYRIHNSSSDKNKQVKYANICRKKMLEKCGCNLTNDEFDVFVKLSFRQKATLRKSISVMNKILKANKKSNYFKQKILFKFLFIRIAYVLVKNKLYFLRWFFKIMRDMKFFIKY